MCGYEFLATDKIEVNGIINVGHENIYKQPFFDRLTNFWIHVLLDGPSGLIEKIFILLCKVILNIP